MSVALFALGGTISAAGRSGSPRVGAVPRLTGAQITAAVPGLAALGVPLDVRDAQAVPSADLTFAAMLDVVAAAEAAVRDGARGVVVTQGTDTLEETAYLVDLVWPRPEPFVLTGAMRNPTLAGADGPANVLAAVRVAADPAARGLGALVVFNDQLHAARWVRKTHSTSTATFASPDLGPIGQVVEDTVRVLARPPRQPPLTRAGIAEHLDATRVALYTATLDDDGALLDVVAEGHQGLCRAQGGKGDSSSVLREERGTGR